jgi:lipid-A-disaccharide synthase
MLRLVEQLRRRCPDFEFTVAIPTPSNSLPAYVQIEHNAQEVLRRSSYGIIKAGTSTLEAMLAGVVQVVVYRASLGTYLVGRTLVTIPSIALPNIVIGRRVVPEVVQTSTSVRTLLSIFSRVLTDPDEAARQREASHELRAALGQPGVSQRIADRMLTLIGRL